MLQCFQFRYSAAFGFFHLRFFHLIATVFSAISFQFQQNKFYPNRPIIVKLTHDLIFIFIAWTSVPYIHLLDAIKEFELDDSFI